MFLDLPRNSDEFLGEKRFDLFPVHISLEMVEVSVEYQPGRVFADQKCIFILEFQFLHFVPDRREVMGIVFIPDEMEAYRRFFRLPGYRFPQRVTVVTHDENVLSREPVENARFTALKVPGDRFLNRLVAFLWVINF
ncbi:hypothetical protein D3C86_1523910 [compost metagenome]